MKLLRLLWVLVSMYLLGACTEKGSYPEVLEKAERCIETNLDSAEIYLKSVDSLALNEEGVRAHYNLLYTAMNDKQWKKHSSDSVMLRVVDYYRGRDDGKLQWAYYLLGRVYRDMGDSPRSLKAFQQALDSHPNSEWYDLLGRIYEQMTYIFAEQNLDSLALNTANNAYRMYKIDNDTLGIAFAYRNIARIFEMQNQIDSMLFYYRKSYKTICTIHNSPSTKWVLSEYLSACMAHGFIEEGEERIDELPQKLKKENPLTFYVLGMIHQHHNRMDSMVYYFQKALQSENILMRSDIYRMLSEWDAKQGNYRQAHLYALNSLDLKDTIAHHLHTESIGKIHALYNYQHVEEENQQLILKNEQRQNWIYLLIIGLLAFMLATTLYINYIRKQKKRYEEQQKKLLYLKEEQYKNSQAYIQKNKEKIAQLENDLQQLADEKDTLKRQLLLSQKELLEVSNQKIQKAQDEKMLLEMSLKKSDIYQLFHRAACLEENPITTENWKELQSILDMTYNGFTKQLYALLPQITEHELHICYLVKIQIPIRDIAKILLRSTSAITNSRARLYKKIQGKEGKAEDFDKLILDL